MCMRVAAGVGAYLSQLENESPKLTLRLLVVSHCNLPEPLVGGMIMEKPPLPKSSLNLMDIPYQIEGVDSPIDRSSVGRVMR